MNLFLISRPKFWFYLAGPFLIGSLLGAKTITDLFSSEFVLLCLYYLVSANIFLYGINDFFDYETDKNNTRKGADEYLLKTRDKKLLIVSFWVHTLLTIVILLTTGGILFKTSVILFNLLSYFYSAPPLRLKGVPFLDFLSNSLYFIPGLTGYFLYSSKMPPLISLLPFLLWTSAMHLFSAIPDIDPDKKSHIVTSAVFLGKERSLFLCLAFWGVFFTFMVLVSPIFIFLALYPLIPGMILVNKRLSVERTYKLFPLLNIASGFIGFIYVAANIKF